MYKNIPTDIFVTPVKISNGSYLLPEAHWFGQELKIEGGVVNPNRISSPGARRGNYQ